MSNPKETELSRQESLKKHDDIETAKVAPASEPERGQWGNQCEFFLSSLGLAVGLGNIWRFPYVCYANGGGTFLIPYVIMLFLVGLPLFFMEMVLGQYAGLSCTKVFSRIAPGLRGMGYGMVTIPTIINFYYTVVMAYALLYMVYGFNSELPWKDCQPDWHTATCISVEDSKLCNSTAGVDDSTVFYNRTCMNAELFCNGTFSSNYTDFNGTHCYAYEDDTVEPCLLEKCVQYTSASEEFFNIKILGMSMSKNEDGSSHVNTEESSWEHWGGVRWPVAGCLFLAWTLVCLSLIKGVQSYGKVVYFTTLFPYVVLTALLIYISTKEGFKEGIEYYLTPDFDNLGQVDVWNNAAGQIFYSLGVAVGSQLLLSSYNKFNSNCHRDALIIGLCNSLTSLYAGFVVFGTLGFIKNYKNAESIDDVVAAGPGLAFIVYPEALAVMTPAPMFSFFFFLMLCLLAISSICASWEALIAMFLDEFPQYRPRRMIIMIVSCFIAFLAGFPICFDSGILLFQLMDDRCSNAILIMAFAELITVSWFYGIDNFFDNVAEMGMRLPKIVIWWWKLLLVVVTPILIFAVTMLSWVNHAPDGYEDYDYPIGAEILGWLLELTPIGIVILFSFYVIYQKHRNGEELAFVRAGPLMSPKQKWGPREDRPQGEVNKAFDE